VAVWVQAIWIDARSCHRYARGRARGPTLTILDRRRAEPATFIGGKEAGSTDDFRKELAAQIDRASKQGRLRFRTGTAGFVASVAQQI
jgi:hypothetical protein